MRFRASLQGRSLSERSQSSATTMDDLDAMFSAIDGIGNKANAMVDFTKMGGAAAGKATAPATKRASVPKKPPQGGKGGGKATAAGPAKDKEKKIPSASEIRDAALIHEFKQIDTNGDGSLSIDELFEGLQRRCWEQDEVSVLFTKLDANRDGLISLEEFLVGMKGGRLLSMANFIPFADFKRQGRIPRRGHKENFEHPTTGQPNTNLCRPRSTFDERFTVFFFISHRWLSPGGAAGHPDNQENSKFELIVEAVDKIMDSNPMLGEGCQAAIWIDFGCVDQDLENPADELNELHEIIAQCDVLLTPVHDPMHAEWELPTTIMDWYKEYKAGLQVANLEPQTSLRTPKFPGLQCFPHHLNSRATPTLIWREVTTVTRFLHHSTQTHFRSIGGGRGAWSRR